MAVLKTLLLSLAVSALVSAAPMKKKRATCTSYTLLNTRGTGELQGESAAFVTMNTNIMAQVSGGKLYDTVYAAGIDQDSTLGTTDIINHITETLATSPDECFILQGWSQGAAATVNALSQLSDTAADAVVGVFLVGNPEHKSGLACNVDNNGGTTTLDVNGLEALFTTGIPSDWVSKTYDVCIYGDGVCDTTHGFGIDLQHLEYPTDSATQTLGTTFGVDKLTGVS